MQESTKLKLADATLFKKQCIVWASQFSTFLCLDNNYSKDKYHQEEFVIAVDAVNKIELQNTNNAFEKLKTYHAENEQTIYGYLSYDLKNDVENLSSKNKDNLNFPELYFFSPRYEIKIKDNTCIINRNYIESIYIKDAIEAVDVSTEISLNKIEWKKRVSKTTYIETVEKIRKDIEEGTVYELNYCYENYTENINVNPLSIFLRINEQVKAPFSSLIKLNDKYVLSFSPERFMQMQEGKMISQPIKGTRKKGSGAKENKALKQDLLQDEKERAENVMIVDLVRNDFARSAITGTIKVDELFGIYEFENIIQMISTVSAQKRENINAIDALKLCFPMGSMTGAPKIKAMQLIEQYENTKRGVYSGAIGYIKPNGDFDFNVVIRTLLYNATRQYLSYQVGGAITYDSKAEKEWEETIAKFQSVLGYL
ncbi:MAG: anthranilate synthase component I family protein [Bacteroidetes bacterium]|nr:anthranilate synthase component I family protein [Bacteroidota bacterium]MCB9227638.1 anthranilate synthase component I family protein [Chitinophagales bacterium]